MLMTTYEFPLPNNGERYDLSLEEFNQFLEKAYCKGFENGSLINATTTSNGSLIKPCPWCGRMPRFRKYSLDRGNGHGYPGHYEYYVECNKCGAIAPQGKQYDIYCSPDQATDAAIKAWNNRL